ncbi:MAG TPA: VOC family protein [Ohtaekwangia sp.]|uniref:VOC family protein n=1 Tax=Ohtaekwangia sp. TaxID=2066019 RepID=UPI002F94C8F1
MKTLGVMHVLFVQDMDRAINFYTQAFDFRVRNKSGFWSNLECDHGAIALTSYGQKTERKETMLIIEVDNYTEAVERIKKYGGQVLKVAEPYEGAPVYNVITVDTENNQIVISQMVN